MRFGVITTNFIETYEHLFQNKLFTETTQNPRSLIHVASKIYFETIFDVSAT